MIEQVVFFLSLYLELVLHLYYIEGSIVVHV